MIIALIEAAKNGDAIAFSNLFDPDGRIDDSCKEGLFQTETHLIGREAIAMHYFNRFIFKTYLVTEGCALDETHGQMSVMIVGQHTEVALKIEDLSEEGLITHLTMTPI